MIFPWFDEFPWKIEIFTVRSHNEKQLNYIKMKEFWEGLSTTQKMKYIISGIAVILGLIFAIMNWKSIEVHFILTSVNIPITMLILLCMAAGYGLATLFDYRKFKSKNKEITSLKAQLEMRQSEDEI